jgi:hypothetical protein
MLVVLPLGPVAQRIEQQPSKLKVAGSNPAGVAPKTLVKWALLARRGIMAKENKTVQNVLEFNGIGALAGDGKHGSTNSAARS